MPANQIAAMLVASLAVVGFAQSPVSAQVLPWDTFEDNLSDSFCDVVNADNAELVVLHDTGQLVIVSGPDVTLVDTFVDQEGDVFLGPDPVGFISFSDDGDGLRSLWWLSLTGNTVTVDGFTGEPTVTNMFPSDYFGVPCDACPLWDDPAACVDPIDTIEPAPVDDIILPGFTINFCGAGAPTAMAMTAVGLFALGFVRRRHL